MNVLTLLMKSDDDMFKYSLKLLLNTVKLPFGDAKSYRRSTMIRLCLLTSVYNKHIKRDQNNV